MIPLTKLRKAAEEALSYLRTVPDIREAEVFVAANGSLYARLNYTSHIPSNGLEEPKSLESYGIGLRVAFNAAEGVKLGFGSEPSDLSLEGVQRALEKARQGAVADPDFVSLPTPGTGRRTLRRYHDPRILRMKDDDLVDAGWEVMEGALDAFIADEDLLSLAGDPRALARLGLILGGDVMAIQERMAIASTHFPRVQTDESTILGTFVTAMVEGQRAKGTGWAVGSHLADFSRQPGTEAARSAVGSVGGRRVSDGEYRVILGPQVITDILNFVMLSGFALDLFYAGASPFQGKLGKQVASEQLTLYDDGAAPGLAASKGVTCEGLPTGRTDIVRDGVLVGLLSSDYETRRMLNDPKGREKLGVEPSEWAQAIAPRNGFRTGRGGGRHFDTVPSTTATNIVIEGRDAYALDDLLRMVGDGLYIGRTWYTYPINGITAGDFSGTVIGDSYLIRDGRLAEPILPNTIRINDNIHSLLDGVMGITARRKGTLIWSADQVVYAPEIAVRSLTVKEIAGYMEEV